MNNTALDIKVLFVEISFPVYKQRDGMWTYIGKAYGKGLLLHDKVYLTDGHYKVFKKSVKIEDTFEGIPRWATPDLVKRYKQAHNILGAMTSEDVSEAQVVQTEVPTQDVWVDVPFPTDEDEPSYVPEVPSFDTSFEANNTKQTQKVKLSQEQEVFVQKALSGQNILVDACIGSGKTTAIQQLCDLIPVNKSVLYLTYNKLLKIDARSKIRNKNVKVTNYHGFAFNCLRSMKVSVGISDLIQSFIKRQPSIPHFDILILDEYQDIELELSQMLDMIKVANPGIQIIAVGDMQQKIYDKTTLNVEEFINEFLGEHIRLEFTKCFRLSANHAAMLGRVWAKNINGVNPNCEISFMKEKHVVEYLAEQNPGDILCLGARTGSLAKTLNILEARYQDKFNKNTVYASISDDDSIGKTEPDNKTAIFTTFDSSKGLERKICVLFDFTESYWNTRIRMPQQNYEILRNIFCVAASRGKEKVIFVEPDEAILSEETLSTPVKTNQRFIDMKISEMFDFKFKEDVEECFSLLETKDISPEDSFSINIKSEDGLIDLSPCIGTFQEAFFFKGYDIDDTINFHLSVGDDKKFLYNSSLKNTTLERKILFNTAIETKQNRYREQVEVPFITEEERETLRQRLASVFDRTETVQKSCSIDFSDEKDGRKIFSARGLADVVKNDVVYELKFISELRHENFLQCACYMVAMRIDKGILWNVRDNKMYEIRVPDRKKFLDAVARAITKGAFSKYYAPGKEEQKEREE